MRYPLFSRNCDEIRSLNGIVQWRSISTCVLERATTTKTQFIEINNTLDSSRQATVSFSSWHFWDTPRLFEVQPAQINSSRQMLACESTMTPLYSVLYIWNNPHRRSKPINVGLWKRNSSCATCTEHKSRFSVLACVKKIFCYKHLKKWRNKRLRLWKKEHEPCAQTQSPFVRA